MAKRVGNEKDAAQMNLEGYNDVFADVINAFLFEGKQEVREEELQEAPVRSSYKGKGTRTQERDLAKYWKRTEIRIFFGTENQMRPDEDMPLRVIGYDGAAYRDQLYYVKGKNGKRRRNHNPRYPVITLVLYFGYEKHWDKPKKLKEVLKNVPEALDPYVNDYEIHVFEVAWMTEEQLQLLKSDFRFVADYFMQMRKNNDYVPPTQTMIHVKEVLELMSVLTKDDRFEKVCLELEGEEEPESMCEVLDRIEKRGIERGIATNLCRNVEALMRNMKLSLRDACQALSITVEEYRAAKG